TSRCTMSKTLIATLALGIGVSTACRQEPIAPGSRQTLVADVQSAGTSAAAVTPTTAHGMNFLVKTQSDLTFCIQVEAGNTAGRSVSMAQCGTVDNQRWMLSNNSDETNLLIESTGMCIDGHFVKGNQGLAMTVGQCGTGDDWRFVYLGSGQI